MFSFWSQSRLPEARHTPDLPPELWLHIFHHLSIYDLASIMYTSHYFLQIAQTDSLFKLKLLQFFSSATRDSHERYYDVFADRYCYQFGSLKNPKMRKLLAYIYEMQWDRIAELQIFPSELRDKDGDNVSIMTHIHRQHSQALLDIIFKQVIWRPDSHKTVDDEIYKLAIAFNQTNIVMDYKPHCYTKRKHDPKRFVLAFYEFFHICIKFNHSEIYLYLSDIFVHPENNDLGDIHIDQTDHYYPPYKFISTAAKHGSTNMIHLLSARILNEDPQLEHLDEDRFDIRDAFIAACELGNYDAFIALSLYFPTILEECVSHRDEHLLAIAIRQDRENFLQYICSKVEIRNINLTGSEFGAIEAAISTNYIDGIKCLLEHGAALSDDMLEWLNQYNLHGIESALRPNTPANTIQTIIDVFDLMNQHQQQAPGMRRI